MSVDIKEEKSYHHLIMCSLFETADILFDGVRMAEFYKKNVGEEEVLRSYLYKLTME